MSTPLSIALLVAAALLNTNSVRAESLKTTGGTQFIITEIADDGLHAVSSGTVVAPIDAHSRIVLTFDSASQTTKSDNEARWKALQAVLEEIKELGVQRADAVAALTAAKGSDDATILASQRQADTYNSKFRDFKVRVRGIIGEQTYKQIDAAATKRAREGRGLLQELADWTTKQLTDLTPTSDAITDKAPEVKVEIVAFLEPAGQDRKPIHVDNYDRLPEGVLAPLPRNGLQMTSEEQAKLNQDLQYAKQAAQSINEIRQQKESLLHGLTNFQGELRSRLRQTLATAEAQVQQLHNRIDALQQSVDGPDKKGALFATFPALSETNTSLNDISTSIAGLKQQLAGLESLRSYDIGNGVGPAMDAFSSSQTLALLGSLETGLNALPKQIGAAANQAAGSAKGLAEDQVAAVTKEVASLKTDIRSDATGSLGELVKTLPATTAMVNSWVTTVKAAREQAGASNSLDQVPTIQRDLNDLLPATVDLRRSGVKNGDYVSIKVRVRDASGSKMLEEKSYDFVIGSMGWHREYTGQLLFAAPTSGPNKGAFQANAGVLVTWRYGYRNPMSKGDKFFNWLNPGFGIHATSLHEGSSTVEVGSGVAIGLWGDLITGGYGWNLGVSANKPYYFVGIGILDLLHKMEKINVPQQ